VRQNQRPPACSNCSRGLDPTKDQSYFLHRLTQAQLSKTLFPVGELHKTEVRRIAAEIGLPNAKKKDSTGICFIGERPFREFLNRYISHAPGPIQDDRGRKLGKHVGLSFYTLGQRQGLGIGGVKEKGAQRGGRRARQPWFVARKELDQEHLARGAGARPPLAAVAPPAGAGRELVRWPRRPRLGAYAAKTRYRQQDAACTLEGCPMARLSALQFAEPQWAVTPGQSAVLYDGEVCLGGGVIANTSGS
jgi:tRNA-specific 2-thiouridylase